MAKLLQPFQNYKVTMNFVKLQYENGYYRYKSGSDTQMDILGNFLASDYDCTWSSFKEWALDEKWRGGSGNITMIEKDNGHIYLSNLYSDKDEPTELHMTIQQFVQLLDDWRNIVCKNKPKEVVIRHEHDQFILETRTIQGASADAG
jgi:hypothetical protein